MSEQDFRATDKSPLDVATPNAARMYDFYLGGSHNLAADREAAARAVTVTPSMIPGARANRAFLQRAVRYLLDQGIRQFLDLGSGIPTVGHVHEIAHSIDPTTRVAYVDNEPVAVAHTRRLLAETTTASITQADLRRPEEVLESPAVAELLDFQQPIGLLAVAVLHFIPDAEDPAGLLRAYRAAMAPGSYLAVSHITDHYDTPDRVAEIARIYAGTTHTAMHRDFAAFTALLDDLPLVSPGAAYATDWQPDSARSEEENARTAFWSAVARLP